MTTPDLYIVMAAVDNKLGLETLYGQKSYIALADKMLGKVLQKGLAENHMHFNVGMDYEMIWLNYVNLSFMEEMSLGAWKKEEGGWCRLKLALFRVLAACYLEDGNYEEGFDQWLRHEDTNGDMTDMVYALLNAEETREISDAKIKCIVRFYQNLVSEDAVEKVDYLMERVYAKYLEYKVSSEFILLYQCCRYITEHAADTFFARVFLQYVRYKNEIFYERQEQHQMQGFLFFQKKYADTRNFVQDIAKRQDIMVEVLRFQSKIYGLKKLEIRMAPDVKLQDMQGLTDKRIQQILQDRLCGQIYQILCAYRRYILESMIGVWRTGILLKKEEKNEEKITSDIDRILREQVGLSELSIPSLGIVFHFIKRKILEDALDVRCWRYVRESGREVMPARMSVRRLITNVAIALEKVRSTIPKLDQYLVGIDAASDENAMEPWVFAQAYRIMRSHGYTIPILKSKNGSETFHRIQNIGFTYHVGEDFRHIASGLRHIDEVLEEFGYKAGDRLGHALALGIDIERWIADNEVIPMPIIEHLENLLWMWGINTCEGLQLSVRLETLENKIIDIAQRIYPNFHDITVKMLYQAYKRKFDTDHAVSAAKLNENASLYTERREKTRSEKIPNVNKDESCRECQEMFCSHWNSEKLLMTQYCPLFVQKYEHVELVPVTKDEIEIYKKLQEYLIYKVERQGIYLEVNPTSNLSMGDFAQIDQHPVFYLTHLHETGKNHVLVTINSDDPAVFCTNVENELAYLYYAAEELGHSKTEILQWIDQIRQQGMDASFVKYEKSTVQILDDIQGILDYIKKNSMHKKRG